MYTTPFVSRSEALAELQKGTVSLNPKPAEPAQQSTEKNGYRKPIEQAPALERIASLAPELSEAELRVLLALAPEALQSEHVTLSISTRQLEAKTKVTRANIQIALKKLSARRFIVVRAGGPSRPAIIKLQLLETVVLQGGITAMPPPGQGGIATIPPLASQQSQYLALEQCHPGIAAMPPPTQNQQLADRSAGVDIDIDSDSDVFNRLLRARPSHFDAARKAAARGMLHGYAAKFGREPDCHPPDDVIVSQFLAIAPWPRLEALVYELMAERKVPGANYAAWFVAVAMQRIHGIAPSALRQKRDEKRRGLKVVQPPLVDHIPPAAPEQLSFEAATATPPAAEADPPAASALTDEQLAELDRDLMRRRLAGAR